MAQGSGVIGSEETKQNCLEGVRVVQGTGAQRQWAAP